MPKVLVTLFIRDGDNDVGKVHAYIAYDTAVHFGDLSPDYVEPLWDAVRPLITGQLIRATVIVDVDVDDYTNNAYSAISDVQEKAVFVFLPCLSTKPVLVTLPTVKETIFTLAGAGKEVDLTNADVTIFTVLMTEALGSGGINAKDSHDVDLCRFREAYQVFRG